jgi:hypothetical protein
VHLIEPTSGVKRPSEHEEPVEKERRKKKEQGRSRRRRRRKKERSKLENQKTEKKIQPQSNRSRTFWGCSKFRKFPNRAPINTCFPCQTREIISILFFFPNHSTFNTGPVCGMKSFYCWKRAFVVKSTFTFNTFRSTVF